MDCPAALVGEDASLGCYIHSKGPLQPWIESLLKDRILALAPRLGPEVSSGACIWVSPRPGFGICGNKQFESLLPLSYMCVIGTGGGLLWKW